MEMRWKSMDTCPENQDVLLMHKEPEDSFVRISIGKIENSILYFMESSDEYSDGSDLNISNNYGEWHDNHKYSPIAWLPFIMPTEQEITMFVMENMHEANGGT